MKKVLIAILLMGITTTVQASNVLQIWRCTANEDATTEQIQAASVAWLKAARSMEGGEQIDAWVDVPIAGSSAGENSFDFVQSAPSFAAWGTWNDAYDGSPAQEADEKWGKLASCSGSSLWLSTKIEVD